MSQKNTAQILQISLIKYLAPLKEFSMQRNDKVIQFFLQLATMRARDLSWLMLLLLPLSSCCARAPLLLHGRRGGGGRGGNEGAPDAGAAAASPALLLFSCHQTLAAGRRDFEIEREIERVD